MIEEELMDVSKSKKSPKILVVEDNIINLKVMVKMLEKRHIIADTASNGKEAINQCRMNHYDMIMMDVQMPVMNGLDATRDIRQLEGYAVVTIIAMTAYTEQEIVDQCMEAGMNHYITKPIEFVELDKHLNL